MSDFDLDFHDDDEDVLRLFDDDHGTVEPWSPSTPPVEEPVIPEPVPASELPFDEDDEEMLRVFGARGERVSEEPFFYDEDADREEFKKDLKSSIKALVCVAIIGLGGYVIIKNTNHKQVKFLPNPESSMAEEVDNTSDKGKTSTEQIAVKDDSEEIDNTQDKVDVTGDLIIGDDVVIDGFDDEDAVIEDFGNEDAATEEVDNSLRTEFENTVLNFVKKNGDINAGITSSDITRFVAIANIDKIFEEDPEFASMLFSDTSTEEYLNDAGKVMAAIEMYNTTLWVNNNSTKDFIRVSDAIMGSQKSQMLKIENYVDSIANAQCENDIDNVNELASELLTSVSSGELSKLDDGVGFTSHVYYALITDGVARNTLNDFNQDSYEVLKLNDRFVSNIFATYSRCASKDKTLSR